MLDACAPIIYRVSRSQAQSAWEYLLTGDNVRCPVKGVATVINRATALRRFVYSAQKLPLAGAHFGAGRS